MTQLSGKVIAVIAQREGPFTIVVMAPMGTEVPFDWKLRVAAVASKDQHQTSVSLAGASGRLVIPSSARMIL